MCCAAQGQIRRNVLPAGRKGYDVVKLEAVRLGATYSCADVGTAAAVALEDGAADGGGDVTSAPAREMPVGGRSAL